MVPESFYQLPPGLYAIKRAASCNTSVHLVQLPQQGIDPVQVLSLSTNGFTLANVTDCVVLKVSGGLVQIAATDADSADPVPPDRLSVKRLDRDSTQLIQPAFVVPANGLSVIGHIARVGDRLALPGQVLGDSSSMNSVCGLQLVWPDKPIGLDLSYRLRLEQSAPMAWATCGSFCGVRDEEARAIGFELALTGQHANEFTVEGLGFFSGGFQVPLMIGKNQGPSGLEHLAGLTLTIKPARKGWATGA